MQSSRSSIRPYAWIPTLYFAEGIPYVVVMSIAAVMYKRLGLSNTDIAFYTSWLYLPWVIKPFWSPVVDMLRTKRWWIVVMQLLVGVAMAGVAFTLPAPSFLQWTLWFFWLMAFSSATHDIAADGFYMLALSEHDQSLYVGIRSTFYRIATIAGQGLLTMLAGTLEVYTRYPAQAWGWTFWTAAAVFALLCLYHAFMLPHPSSDAGTAAIGFRSMVREFCGTFVSFFRKPGILAAIGFMLLYRLPEALLTKICPLFLLDRVGEGGLGLTTAELGFVQGTVGVMGLTIGGILGGICIARGGFGRWLLPMVAAITLPDAVYILLAYYQPEALWLTNCCIFIEQFGYGFGFTAYMLYLIYFSQGASKTTHYAFCTGFMALSMMLPGMVAGVLQEAVGYLNFFIIVMCLTPLTLLAARMVRVDADFGREEGGETA
ncbi:MAG: MFS transporter [Alloprevotella sp.]|nr:MFS transporter [Alloprevotella sp.]